MPTGNVINYKIIKQFNQEVIRKIRFYQRFRFSESVKSASNFDAHKTNLLRKNAEKTDLICNNFIF